MPDQASGDAGGPWNGFPAIETPRLSISATRSHAARKKAYGLIHANQMESELGLPAGLTWSRFVRPFHQVPAPWVYLLSERESGEAIGVILLWGTTRTAWPMMHYGIARSFRGRGFGTEAVSAVVRTLLDRDLVPGIGAVVAHSNGASSKLARAAGFRPLHEEPDATLYGVAKGDAIEIWMLAREAAPKAQDRRPGLLGFGIRAVAFRIAAQLSLIPYLRRTVVWIMAGLS